jgi:hypothetical protein
VEKTMAEPKETHIMAVLLADGWHQIKGMSFKFGKTIYTGTATGDVHLGTTATWTEAATWADTSDSKQTIFITAKLESILALQHSN